MINWVRSGISDYSNRNSVLVDPIGETFSNKNWFGARGKIADIIRGQKDAKLTEEQVRDGYYYLKERGVVKLIPGDVKFHAYRLSDKIVFSDERGARSKKRLLFEENEINQPSLFDFISEKSEVIRKNTCRILNKISAIGILPEDCIDYQLLLTYIKSGYITYEDLASKGQEYIGNLAGQRVDDTGRLALC